MTAGFDGAKLAILFKGRVLSLLRDDTPRIPHPGRWDLPGGGRDGDEAPQTCALRETLEETGLCLDPATICHQRLYGDQWFFVARATAISALRLGDEGQALRWFEIRAFLDSPRGIAHLHGRLRDYLGQS